MADTNPRNTRPGRALARCGRRLVAKASPGASARVIDGLRAKGLEIVPVSELAGWTFDQVMPPLPLEDRSALVNWYVFITRELGPGRDTGCSCWPSA